MSTTKTKIPSSYSELLKAFRALVKENEIAKTLFQDTVQSGLKWKERAERAEGSSRCDQKRAVFEIGLREEAEAARDLALAGKAGAEEREAQLLGALVIEQESNREKEREIRYLSERLIWSESKLHASEKKLFELGFSSAGGLDFQGVEKARQLLPYVHISDRGEVR